MIVLVHNGCTPAMGKYGPRRASARVGAAGEGAGGAGMLGLGRAAHLVATCAESGRIIMFWRGGGRGAAAWRDILVAAPGAAFGFFVQWGVPPGSPHCHKRF